MTCKEAFKIKFPDSDLDWAINNGCPGDYGFMLEPAYVHCDAMTCSECWEREVSEEKMEEKTEPKILDSGNRREFETGAVRDIQEGKGRCDLMPLFIVGDYLEDAVINFVANFQYAGDTDHLYCAIKIFSDERYPERYTMFLEVAKHFEEGAKKYGEHNWQKGIPVRCYIDSAVRHYLKHKRGDKDEPHDRAFVWNLLCAIWTCENKPELNDYAKGKDE